MVETEHDGEAHWHVVGRTVAEGRRNRVWASDYSSVSSWIEAVAKRVERAPNVVRRWAAVIDFLDSFAGRDGMPDSGDLLGSPVASLELVARAHAISRGAGVDLARKLTSAEPPTVRELRSLYEKLNKAERLGTLSPAMSQLREELFKNLSNFLPAGSPGQSHFVLAGNRISFRYIPPTILVATAESPAEFLAAGTLWTGVHLMPEPLSLQGFVSSLTVGWFDLTASLLDSLILVVPADFELVEGYVRAFRALRVRALSVYAFDNLAMTFELLMPLNYERFHDRRDLFHEALSPASSDWTRLMGTTWASRFTYNDGSLVYFDPALSPV